MTHTLDDRVKLSVLGGLGEIGLNMLVFECAGQALVVDAGMMFAAERALGIDVIVPRLTYLERVRPKLLGIIVTHGHEDHIGAVPYLLRQFPAPVYGDELSLGFVRRRLRENELEAELRPVKPYSRLVLGPFTVEFIPVTHSIPGSFALAITTAAGLIIHTGDFKIDDSPVDGKPFDREAFRRLGERGVTLLLSDSTNAEQVGRTPSESSLRTVLRDLLSRAKGRVFLSIFSSHLHRIRQLAELSLELGRFVVPVGRRMVESVRLGLEFGPLQPVAQAFMSLQDTDFLPINRVAYLVSGSQGEPLSALVKIAAQAYPGVRVSEGDTVILSSRFIPGNERAIHALVDQLFRHGADVYYETIAPVHVSGHASSGELAEMIQLTRPKYFIPVHGEYRHLSHHRRLAIQCGVPEKNCLLLQDGDSVVLKAGEIRRADAVEFGRVMVAGSEMVDEELVKERLALARRGAVIVSLALSRATGKLVAPPEIHCCGLFAGDGANLQVRRAGEELAEWLERADRSVLASPERLKGEVERALGAYFRHEFGLSPVVMPCVVEI